MRKVRTDVRKYFFINIAVHMWGKLNEQTVSVESIGKFKRLFDVYVRFRDEATRE